MRGTVISHNIGPKWKNTPSYCDFLGFSYIHIIRRNQQRYDGEAGGGKDQGDETEGLERGGIKVGKIREGEGGSHFSLFNPNQRKRYHSATWSCSVEQYKLRYSLADFLPNWNFRGISSAYHFAVIIVPLPSVCLICMSVIQQNSKYKKRKKRR